MSKNKRGTGSSCSAVDCTMRRSTNLLSEVKMYRFPSDPVRRVAWCNSMKREGNWLTKNSVICNKHFLTGKPSTDPQHPDYVPSLFSFTKDASKQQQQKKLERYERSIKRSERNLPTETSCTVSIQTGNDNFPSTSAESIDSPQVASTDSLSAVTSVEEIDLPPADAPNVNNHTPHADASSGSNRQHAEVQTDISMKDIELLQKKFHILEEQNACFRKDSVRTQTYNSVFKNVKNFKFYTGLENIGIFNFILCFLLSFWRPKSKVSLKPCEQLLLVLMKLRLGLKNRDLACRFEIGVGTVSTVFHSWLNVIYVNFKNVIKWPSQKTIKRNMPQCFRDVSLGNVRCIIDCTEIFIQKPKNFEARALTYSNYKHHNTIKFLVGITPSGEICFISKSWGGRVSDKCLTRNSGFLELLKKDDVILADRGFRIEDLLSEKNATLFIPASTKNKTQLSVKEVRGSRKMSRVRVHVERAIRKIKTFKILDGTVPISLIKRKQDEEDNGDEFSTIDKILTVICALYNLSNPIIKR